MMPFGRAYFLSANINTKKVSSTPVKIYHLDPLPLLGCQDASRFKKCHPGGYEVSYALWAVNPTLIQELRSENFRL